MKMYAWLLWKVQLYIFRGAASPSYFSKQPINITPQLFIWQKESLLKAI